MKHITFALLAASVVLSGCIVAAPTPQLIVVTATSAPARTAAPTATVRVATPQPTPRPAHKDRETFAPGPSWERSSWLDSTCATAEDECSVWMFKDQELIAGVYDSGIGFTVILKGTGDVATESNALQAAASHYGVSDLAILAAIDSASKSAADTRIVGDWGWSVTISDEYLTIVFLFVPDAVNSGSSGSSSGGSAQG